MNLVERFLKNNPCYKNNVGRVDSRYRNFQDRGPQGGMLHSVGCAQPSAMVFIELWDVSTNQEKCVHGFIDANTGTIYQTLPWHYRGWHAGQSTGNNTLLGVEMCESEHIRYLKKGEPGYAPGKFVVLNKEKAQADCKRTYDAAVELFAMLAKMYKWNVETGIMSHKEGYRNGVASNHGDPEHYWTGLEMPYTMNGFRSDVKKLITGETSIKKPIRIVTGAFNNEDYARSYLKEVRKQFPEAYPVDGDWKMINL